MGIGYNEPKLKKLVRERVGVLSVKVFHSKQNLQSGASIVVLLVGLALSAISIAAAAAFFAQTNAKAKALMGESESMTNLALLLKQSFNNRECLKLDIYKGKFASKIKDPIILSDEAPPPTSQERKGGNATPSKFSDKGLSALRNSVGKGFEVSRIQMIQRTSVIGKDPGRVLADLKIQVIYKGKDQFVQKSKAADKIEPQLLTIPLLFDLDSDFKAVGCMDTPGAEDICKQNNGTFNAKDNSQVCNLTKR